MAKPDAFSIANRIPSGTDRSCLHKSGATSFEWVSEASIRTVRLLPMSNAHSSPQMETICLFSLIIGNPRNKKTPDPVLLRSKVNLGLASV